RHQYLLPFTIKKQKTAQQKTGTDHSLSVISIKKPWSVPYLLYPRILRSSRVRRSVQQSIRIITMEKTSLRETGLLDAPTNDHRQNYHFQSYRFLSYCFQDFRSPSLLLQGEYLHSHHLHIQEHGGSHYSGIRDV
ncbi:MAG: hypothetical protein WC091_03295, partial [Sulfuricellaceae bacterium]